MAECERLKKCAFFQDQLTYMPKTADLMKQAYCLGDKTTCARYLVASKGTLPPADLFPNEANRALEILSDKNM